MIAKRHSEQAAISLTPEERSLWDNIPWDDPLPDELEAIREGEMSLLLEGGVRFEDVDWGLPAAIQ